MTAAEPSSPEPGADATIHDIEADIESTRAELGHTVEALTAKLDVKQQAKDKVDDAKTALVDTAETLRTKGSDVSSQVIDAATDDDGTVLPVVPIAAAAVVAIIVGLVIWTRRR